MNNSVSLKQGGAVKCNKLLFSNINNGTYTKAFCNKLN